MSKPAAAPHVDDDDLDDLDDVLQDFAAKPVSAATPARAVTPPPPSATALPPATSTAATTTGEGQEEEGDGLDEDFLRDLQREMEAMLGPLPNPPANGSTTLDEDEEQRAMAAMFAKLMGEAAAAGPPGAEGEAGKGKERAAAGASSAGAGPPGEEDFQETIRRTMAKMRESGEGVKAGLDANDADPMAAMLAALAGGAGGQSEDELRGALEGIMEQLMSKDLLEEPLQALAEKYPDWLAANRATLPPADLAKYEKQSSAIEQLLVIFRSPTYSADNAVTNKQVMDLMQSMQECGAPPKAIMGDLPEGMEFGEDGMPNPNMDNCTIS